MDLSFLERVVAVCGVALHAVVAAAAAAATLHHHTLLRAPRSHCSTARPVTSSRMI